MLLFFLIKILRVRRKRTKTKIKLGEKKATMSFSTIVWSSPKMILL